MRALGFLAGLFLLLLLMGFIVYNLPPVQREIKRWQRRREDDELNDRLG